MASSTGENSGWSSSEDPQSPATPPSSAAASPLCHHHHNHHPSITSPRSSSSSRASDTEPLLPFSPPSEAIAQLPPISRLPNEILVDILRYALEPENTYDALVQIEERRDPAEYYGNIEVVGDDGAVAFVLSRREICLSRVCGLWRDLMTMGYIDLWAVDDNSLYITGEQWFHPSFPFKTLLGSLGPYHFTHSFILIHFRNFSTPVQLSEPTEPPLFAPPVGANFFDSHTPLSYTTLHSNIKHIHLLLCEESNISLDAVLGRVHFSVAYASGNMALAIPVEVKRLGFTINSGSRLFVSTTHSSGIAGGILSWNVADLEFVVNSWKADFGWEVPRMIADVVKWVLGVTYRGPLLFRWEDDMDQQAALKNAVYVKLPEAPEERERMTRGWLLPEEDPFTGWSLGLFDVDIGLYRTPVSRIVLEGFGDDFDLVRRFGEGIRGLFSAAQLVLVVSPDKIRMEAARLEAARLLAISRINNIWSPGPLPSIAQEEMEHYHHHIPHNNQEQQNSNHHDWYFHEHNHHLNHNYNHSHGNYPTYLRHPPTRFHPSSVPPTVPPANFWAIRQIWDNDHNDISNVPRTFVPKPFPATDEMQLCPSTSTDPPGFPCRGCMELNRIINRLNDWEGLGRRVEVVDVRSLLRRRGVGNV